MQTLPILIARNAPWPHLLWLLYALAMALLGGLGVATTEGVLLIASWAVLLTFVVVSSILLHRLLDQRPRIVIDGDGVFDRHLGVGTIPWSQIHDAEFIYAGWQPFIALGVLHAERWVARMPWYKRWGARSSARWYRRLIHLYLADLTADPNTVLRAIHAWLAAKREGRLPPTGRAASGAIDDSP